MRREEDEGTGFLPYRGEATTSSTTARPGDYTWDSVLANRGVNQDKLELRGVPWAIDACELRLEFLVPEGQASAVLPEAGIVRALVI